MSYDPITWGITKISPPFVGETLDQFGGFGLCAEAITFLLCVGLCNRIGLPEMGYRMIDAVGRKAHLSPEIRMQTREDTRNRLLKAVEDFDARVAGEQAQRVQALRDFDRQREAVLAQRALDDEKSRQDALAQRGEMAEKLLLMTANPAAYHAQDRIALAQKLEQFNEDQAQAHEERLKTYQSEDAQALDERNRLEGALSDPARDKREAEERKHLTDAVADFGEVSRFGAGLHKTTWELGKKLAVLTVIGWASMAATVFTIEDLTFDSHIGLSGAFNESATRVGETYKWAGDSAMYLGKKGLCLTGLGGC